jgi:hypothetical protein
MHFEVILALAESTPSDNGTDWTLILSLVATGLALISVGWNIYNAISERKAKRRPDVHASLVVDGADPNSALAFINAGPGMARNPLFLLLEDGHLCQGGIGTAFLPAEAHKEFDLGFRSTKRRSTFVWGYMDIDGNVHVKSNGGKHARHKHPARVELGEAFRQFYPSESLPASRPLLPYLGEKEG